MATPLSPLDPRGAVLGDEVYATLSEAILDGTLLPGERLRDQEIAERLGVSRTPVREALQRLERSGLVEVSPNRYTRVSVPDAKVIEDTDEFVAFTIGNCVRLVVDRGDDADVAHTIELLGVVIDRSRADDTAGVRSASAHLFEHLVHSTGNLTILAVLRERETALRRNLSEWSPSISCPIERTRTYEQLRDAVVQRDPHRAETLFRSIHGFS